MELKYIFYITVNVINGKFYFGVHETNPDVFDGYIGCGIYRLSNATKDFAFHKAVRKYGYLNFKRTIIKVFPHTEKGRVQAFNLEREVVNTSLLKSKTCYNTSEGGRENPNNDLKKRVYMFDLKGNFLRSFKSSRDAAKYLNTDNEESTRQAIKNNCYGKTNSSNGYYWSFTKKFNYSTSDKKIALYTLEGKFIRTFTSISEAEASLQVSTISQAIQTGCSSAGYLWKIFSGSYEDIPQYISIFNKNKYLPIKMYDSNNKFICEYVSIELCVKEHPELKTSQINRVLKNIIRSHKGYTFKYKDEDIVSLILK